MKIRGKEQNYRYLSAPGAALHYNFGDFLKQVDVSLGMDQLRELVRLGRIQPMLRVRLPDRFYLAWEDYPDPHTLIKPDWLARVRQAGLRIMSWHEERADEIEALVALGLDDICTNDPALAHRLIVEGSNQPNR